MGMPVFQEIMLPLLRYCSGGQEVYRGDAIEAMAEELGVSDDERAELLDSGKQSRFDNRVGWARSYLKGAGLIKNTRRGYFQITDRGIELLGTNPNNIDIALLDQYPEFRAFRKGKSKDNGDLEAQSSEATTYVTPEEALEQAHRDLSSALEAEIIQQIKDCTPAFFERLVVELLVKMGYGGTLRDAGQALGKSGDGGVDGVIKEDRLGLGVIYIQAKRWDGTVGRPEVQKFAGALQGRRARRGVFLTTAAFSSEAVEYANNIDSRIALVDGDKLARLMVDYGLGVSHEVSPVKIIFSS